MTDKTDESPRPSSATCESSPRLSLSPRAPSQTPEPEDCEDLGEEYKNFLSTNEYDDSFVKLSLESVEARKKFICS